MDLIRSLENSIKNRSPKAIKIIDKICEDNLEYKKIAECSPEMGIKAMMEGLEVSVEGINIIPLQGFEITARGTCKHYTNREMSEGILYSAKFFDINQIYSRYGKVFAPKLKEFKIFAYGKIWDGKLRFAEYSFDCKKPQEKLFLQYPIIKEITIEEIERICRR